MKKIIILACSCFLLAACGNSAKTNKSTSADSTATQTVDIHNAETSLDYEGTYKGVFPAADCPGIETLQSKDFPASLLICGNFQITAFRVHSS